MSGRRGTDRWRWLPDAPSAAEVGIVCMMLVILAAFWALWMRSELAYAEDDRPVRAVAQDGPRAVCAYGGEALSWHAGDLGTGLPCVASDGDGRLLLLAADGSVTEV